MSVEVTCLGSAHPPPPPATHLTTETVSVFETLRSVWNAGRRTKTRNTATPNCGVIYHCQERLKLIQAIHYL